MRPSSAGNHETRQARARFPCRTPQNPQVLTYAETPTKVPGHQPVQAALAVEPEELWGSVSQEGGSKTDRLSIFKKI